MLASRSYTSTEWGKPEKAFRFRRNSSLLQLFRDQSADHKHEIHFGIGGI